VCGVNHLEIVVCSLILPELIRFSLSNMCEGHAVSPIS